MGTYAPEMEAMLEVARFVRGQRKSHPHQHAMGYVSKNIVYVEHLTIAPQEPLGYKPGRGEITYDAPPLGKIQLTPLMPVLGIFGESSGGTCRGYPVKTPQGRELYLKVGHMGDGVTMENSIVHSISHRNIAKVLFSMTGKGDDPSTLYFATFMKPYLGDIYNYLFPNQEALYRGITQDIVPAVRYLHKCTILHLDIKKGNILRDAKERLILTDFNSAARIGTMLNFSCTTKECEPPELKRRNLKLGIVIATPHLDYWGLGSLVDLCLVAGGIDFTTPSGVNLNHFKLVTMNKGGNRYDRYIPT
nr:protein kinase-like protein [Salmonid herpesvirus 1]